MVAIFGGKWWLLVARKNGGVGESRFGTVLEWFWEHKIQRLMYGRWNMMNFFYYLRNKKKTKCHKELKDLPFFIFLSLYENEIMEK